MTMPKYVYNRATVELEISFPDEISMEEMEARLKKLAEDNNAKLVDWWNVELKSE
jgi:hypothetical protein